MIIIIILLRDWQNTVQLSCTFSL